MLHKPSGAAKAADAKSEQDRLHNNVPVLRDTQPPDRTDTQQLNNQTREHHHQQLNQIYQRFQQHHNQQQHQHSEPQHPREDARNSKLRNSQPLSTSSQHLKTAAMQLTNGTHHHNKQMYQRTAANGLAAGTTNQPAIIEHPLLQSNSSSQAQPSKQLPSSSHHHHHHTQLADLIYNSSAGRESQPLHPLAEKHQPLLRNNLSSSSARNQFTSHQLQENDLHARLGQSSSNRRQEQQERESNEMFAIDSQLDNLDLGDFKGEGEEEEEEVSKESDALSLLEKNLPVELSFLIRQQAYCAAKMNYLERQIRELKEACQTTTALNVNQNYAAHPKYGGGISRFTNNNHISASTAAKLNAHSKNGNFIPSDDSGGEYSRATMSDDDELSSLLDQIAKSIRPDRCQSIRSSSQSQHHELQQQYLMHHNQPLQQVQYHLHQQQQPQLHQHQSLLGSRVNYGVYGNTQQQQVPLPPQQYTFINPSQLHHQTVPVFVMSSPITVAPHPSSINSSVMGEVHFQPEPRYNQYYEDFYLQQQQQHQQQQQQQNINTPSSSTLYRRSGVRSRLSDGNLLGGSSLAEQLSAVNSQQQREKRQIKSQLKSTDNWLKMRSSNLCNIGGTTTNLSNDKNCDGTSSRQQQQVAGGDASEIDNQNSATATATATNAKAASAGATTTTATASATATSPPTTNSSSAEAGSSSSTATEVENLNSVIEDSKR